MEQIPEFKPELEPQSRRSEELERVDRELSDRVVAEVFKPAQLATEAQLSEV